MPNTTNANHVVLRNVRLSYTHLDKPYAQKAGQDPKYSATILVPKNPANNKALIDSAIAAATQKAIEKHGNAFPPMPKVSVHDGDGPRPSDNQPFGEECRGCWVFTASSKQPVPIVDLNLQPILDATQIYSGMYANVGVSFFGYITPQNKGIGVALDNVQKTADGEPLGGQRPSAEDDFGSLDQQASAPAAGNYPVTPGSAPNISGPAQQYPQYAPQAPAAPQGYQPPVDIPQGYPQAPASTYPQQGAAPQYPGYPQQY